MRALVLLLLASCVVIRIEPSRAPMTSAPLDAGVPPGVTCTTEAVPGAPTVCVDSRDNVLAPLCSFSTTGALSAACGSALTAPDEFTHGEDPMPIITWTPHMEAH